MLFEVESSDKIEIVNNNIDWRALGEAALAKLQTWIAWAGHPEHTPWVAISIISSGLLYLFWKMRDTAPKVKLPPVEEKLPENVVLISAETKHDAPINVIDLWVWRITGGVSMSGRSRAQYLNRLFADDVSDVFDRWLDKGLATEEEVKHFIERLGEILDIRDFRPQKRRFTHKAFLKLKRDTGNLAGPPVPFPDRQNGEKKEKKPKGKLSKLAATI